MDLGSRAAWALRWATLTTLAGQIITWAVTIIVIRLLTPVDYGLMAMAMVVIGFLTLVNELGMGAVIVQRAEIDVPTVRRIFGLAILINCAFFVLLFSAAPMIAEFFAEPRLTAVARVLSIQFLLSGLEVVPVARLERDMDFRRKSITSLVASVSGSMVTLAMALTGSGVWALVGGNLAMALARVVGFNLAAPFPHWPDFRLRGMGEMAAFGGYVTLERALWYFYNQVDQLLVGRVLGAKLLGFYTVAMHLASLIMHKTGGILYEVSFPTLARAQHDERFGAYLVKACRVVSLLAFPAFFGISAVAGPLVAVLLGPTWTTAGSVLAVVTLVMPLRMLSNLLPPALQARGYPAVSVGNLVIAMIVMPVAFYVGTRHGLMGVAWAWVVAFPLVLAVAVWRSTRILQLDMRVVAQAVAVPAACAALMWLGVVSVERLMTGFVSTIVILGSMILGGMAIYSGLAAMFLRPHLQEMLTLVRR